MEAGELKHVYSGCQTLTYIDIYILAIDIAFVLMLSAAEHKLKSINQPTNQKISHINRYQRDSKREEHYMILSR